MLRNLCLGSSPTASALRSPVLRSPVRRTSARRAPKALSLKTPPLNTLAAGIAAFGLLFVATPASADDITGIWYDDTGRGAVRLAKCGQSICGRIVWLKSPLKKSGEPLTDELNPKASKRSRPICGLQVIGRLKRMNNGSWDNGWIYDPKVGKSYDVAVELSSRNRLKVTGYLGTKFLSRTLTWRRAPGTLPSCDGST
ncbi:MAG: DUF2147 domain-containing protein, partial [Pseudomonadota bacterium]